jgi:hypothetical protein
MGPPEPGDPHWMPAFDDLMAAAALIYEESARAEGRAEAYEHRASQAFAFWQERAVRAREDARQLNRAAAILDWVARRADRLHLLSQPARKSEEVSRTTQFQPRGGKRQ